MSGVDLERMLRTAGKAFFVKYFDALAGGRTNESLCAQLRREEGYKRSSCNTKVSTGRRIIREGHARAALLNVSGSDRVPKAVRVRAEKIAWDVQRRR